MCPDSNSIPEPGSFRDPAGFVFTRNSQVLRRVNPKGMSDYTMLVESGLYSILTKNRMLISHIESVNEIYSSIDLRPEVIPIISYPYEWTFSQLKSAALLTLDIQEQALLKGMTLKDASPFNVQFLSDSPIFIDTLSFAKNDQSVLWTGYRQFCELFIVPLLLKKYGLGRLRLPELYFSDGSNLEVAASSLPFRAFVKKGIFFHIYLHGNAQKKFSHTFMNEKTHKKVSVQSQIILVKSLRKLISRIRTTSVETVWSDYYKEIHYSEVEFNEKKRAVSLFLSSVKPEMVLDLAGNSGEFSEIAIDLGSNVLLIDSDESAIETALAKNFSTTRDKQYYLKLVIDILNPTAGQGWAGNERKTLGQRCSPDLVMALALTHHLFITHSISWARQAEYFSTLSKYLVIEHCSGEDSQVKILNQNKQVPDDQLIFEVFEEHFLQFFDLIDSYPIKSGARRLYLLKKKGDDAHN
jgi:hypothetical protein